MQTGRQRRNAIVVILSPRNIHGVERALRLSISFP